MVCDRWISVVVDRIPNQMLTYLFYTKLNTRNLDRGASNHSSVLGKEFLVGYDQEEFTRWRPLR